MRLPPASFLPPSVAGPAFPICLLVAIFLLACGVAGPPVPPTPKIPQPPSDLAAEQRGERVLLRWSLPLFHTDGSRVTRQRAELFRWVTESLDQLPERFGFEARSVHWIPEAMLDVLGPDTRVEFADPLGPDLLAQHAGHYVVYGVKALNRRNQDAGFSNLVALRVFPTPTPIAQLATGVTEQAIELRWDPPTRTTSGTPLEAITGYRVFRRSGLSDGFQLIGATPTPSFTDPDFRFGETYSYRVRTLAQFGTDTVESDDSGVAQVTPRDVFPPPTPTNLVAIATPAGVDLTWDASPAADVAGYFVYRSEQAGTGYQRLTLAATPVLSFSDTHLSAGKTYYYVVTAVDHNGNESAFSQPAAAAPPPG